MKTETNIEARLLDYIEGRLSESERSELELWLNQNPEFKKEVELILGDNLYVEPNENNNCPDKLKEKLLKKGFRWNYYAAAAVIVLLLASGAAIYSLMYKNSYEKVQYCEFHKSGSTSAEVSTNAEAQSNTNNVDANNIARNTTGNITDNLVAVNVSDNVDANSAAGNTASNAADNTAVRGSVAEKLAVDRAAENIAKNLVADKQVAVNVSDNVDANSAAGNTASNATGNAAVRGSVAEKLAVDRAAENIAKNLVADKQVAVNVSDNLVADNVQANSTERNSTERNNTEQISDTDKKELLAESNIDNKLVELPAEPTTELSAELSAERTTELTTELSQELFTAATEEPNKNNELKAQALQNNALIENSTLIQNNALVQNEIISSPIPLEMTMEYTAELVQHKYEKHEENTEIEFVKKGEIAAILNAEETILGRIYVSVKRNNNKRIERERAEELVKKEMELGRSNEDLYAFWE